MTVHLNGCWFDLAKVIQRLKSPQYRRLSGLSMRIAHHGRNRSGNIRTAGISWSYVDAPSFLWAFREIFSESLYEFPCDHGAPLVIDVGANIGVGVWSYLSRFPRARIIAFEPDPRVYACLEQNCRELTAHGSATIETHCAAAWIHDGTMGFSADGSDGGHLDSSGAEQVACRDLATLLREHACIDFLKIDVEGAELDLLAHCRAELVRVRSLFIEYHAPRRGADRLNELLEIITEAGFTTVVNAPRTIMNPFKELTRAAQGAPGFRYQLNITATRLAS